MLGTTALLALPAAVAMEVTQLAETLEAAGGAADEELEGGPAWMVFGSPCNGLAAHVARRRRHASSASARIRPGRGS